MEKETYKKEWVTPELTIISSAESSENVMHVSTWSVDDDEGTQIFRPND